MSLNSAKNFALPCVTIQLVSIKADKQRLAAKNTKVGRYKNGLLQGYDRPTPITIDVKVSIITKYVTDLYQIFGKFCSMFQPQVFYSWAVPTNAGIVGVQQLRNKIQWDLNFPIDSKEKLQQTEQDRYSGTMNFSIQSWMFPNKRQCQRGTIYDIGTTVLVSNQLQNRIDGLIDQSAPLVSAWLHSGGTLYKNPRQFANAHVRILKAFVTMRDFNFRLADGKFDQFRLQNSIYNITFDGYNLSKARALLVPKRDWKTKNKKESFQYDNTRNKLWPVIGQQTGKYPIISGYPLQIVSQSNNTLVVQIGNIDYKGQFDVILYDQVDYDSLNNAEGFLLKAI